MNRICRLVLLLLGGLLCLTACEDDSYHAPSVQMDFVEFHTDAGGMARTLVRDNGDTLTLANPFGGLKPDTLYRYLAIYQRQTAADGQEQALLSDKGPITTPWPKRYENGVYVDSVRIQSVWRGGNYLNVAANVLTQGGGHAFGFAHLGWQTHEDGTRLLHLLLYHYRGNDPEAYTRTTYVSCPLYPYMDHLRKGQDTLVFSANQYGKGITTWRIPY